MFIVWWQCVVDLRQEVHVVDYIQRYPMTNRDCGGGH